MRLDSIKYIFEKPFLSRRIARWQVQLSKCDIQYVSQKSIKKSAIAEFLVKRASKDYEPIDFDFRDENLMAVSHFEEKSIKKTCWKLYFNRAHNLRR